MNLISFTSSGDNGNHSLSTIEKITRCDTEFQYGAITFVKDAFRKDLVWAVNNNHIENQTNKFEYNFQYNEDTILSYSFIISGYVITEERINMIEDGEGRQIIDRSSANVPTEQFICNAKDINGLGLGLEQLEIVQLIHKTIKNWFRCTLCKSSLQDSQGDKRQLAPNGENLLAVLRFFSSDRPLVFRKILLKALLIKIPFNTLGKTNEELCIKLFGGSEPSYDALKKMSVRMVNFLMYLVLMHGNVVPGLIFFSDMNHFLTKKMINEINNLIELNHFTQFIIL